MAVFGKLIATTFLVAAGALRTSPAEHVEWDVAVNEAVKEVNPLKSVHAAKSKIEGQPDGDHTTRRYVFVSHDHAGHDLISKAAQNLARFLNTEYCEDTPAAPCKIDSDVVPARVWFFPSITEAQLEKLRSNKWERLTVNIVRDPLAMFASGYLSGSLRQSNGLKMMRTMSVADRASVEAPFFLKTQGAAMAKTYHGVSGMVLNAHYESLTASPEEFAKNMNSVMDFFLTKASKPEAIEAAKARMNSVGLDLEEHVVARPEIKERAKEMLGAVPEQALQKFEELRSRMEYA
uniref:Sulfotransferase domain-containing protein n=1 Tax=Alexandrium catenella TaxID=2925 RepID=A0A7S1M4N0_ALECA|mmetsp:Transcript_19708/g.53592  ORF Transcript_19708/g.53592 Transcript_19708/m.53592 type:complete len:291 (+) Transcript_19708:33-905(+)